jgi:hypothetical protein
VNIDSENGKPVNSGTFLLRYGALMTLIRKIKTFGINFLRASAFTSTQIFSLENAATAASLTLFEPYGAFALHNDIT